MAKTTRNKEDRGSPILFPEGAARFAHLQTPDDFEGKVEFSVQVIINESDPEWQAALDTLKAFQDERDIANGRSTKDHLTCLKSKNGEKFLKFRSKSKEFFNVVDANKKPYTEEPWTGSRVKVFASPEWYKGFGGGITLYLHAVQVLEDSKDNPDLRPKRDGDTPSPSPAQYDVPF